MKRKWLRFPPPLHVLVPLLVLACGLLALFINGVVLLEWNLRRELEGQIETATVQAQRLAARVRKQQKGLENRVDYQARVFMTHPNVKHAGVCDAEGKVLYCSQADWVGRTLRETASPELAELVKRTIVEKKPLHAADPGKALTVTHPVSFGTDDTVRYVVFIERDLASPMRERRHAAYREALVSAGVVCVASLLLWALLYVIIRRRMRVLIQHVAISQTGDQPLLPMPGGDEFAEISEVLSKAEHLLKEVAENTDELIWVVTPDFKPAYLSPAFERIWMRRRDDIYQGPGKIPEYTLKEYHAMLKEAFAAVIERRATHLHVEYRMIRGDGQIRWIESRGFPVHNKKGEVHRIVGISRDITEEKNLQEQIVNIAEQERHSLGHDLHDDACQRLAAMKLKSETLTLQLQQEHSPHLALARELTSQLSGTSTLLRNIARGLSPVEVEGDGLMLALRKLVLMQEAIHEVPCFFVEEHTVIVSNKIVATHLYRIAQESITNAARHGKPERIEVRFESLADHVRLSVINDGRPFQEPVPGHNGMGLKIVRYRASAIGATINIHARTDGTPGTIAECLVSHDICLSEPRNGIPVHDMVDSPQI